MNPSTDPEFHVAVIGGGPAGLMAAETVAAGGMKVDVYEGCPSAGRKFLVAGKGGLNLTHDEPFNIFLGRYDSRQACLEPALLAFGPDDLRNWAKDLGVETFVGTSKRVFPTDMKSHPMLRRWLQRLQAAGVNFHFRHRWIGWDITDSLVFETPEGTATCTASATVLALGGGSWPVTGSTGAWVNLLESRDIQIAPLKPSNCGFEVGWSEHFRSRFAGVPVKTVAISFPDPNQPVLHQRGEFVITEHGVEGSLVYAASAPLRNEIETHGIACLHLDLLPDFSFEQILEKLSRPRGSRSLASHLEKNSGLKGVKAGLLWEFVPREAWNDPQRLAQAIKDLALPLLRPRPIEEAISSAGGVLFNELDDRLMLKKLPGVFCAGEMLDWEAPTGGYLLTACFATGRAAGLGALEWLMQLA